MNPAFIILILLSMVVLWLISSALFKPIGRLIEKVINNLKENVSDEDQKEKENKDYE